MGLVLLSFLKNNWELVLIGVLIAALGAYIVAINLNREHLKSKLQEVTQEYEAFKSKLDQQKIQFEKEAQLARKVSDEVLRQKEIILEQEYTDKVERIKHDKAIASISVPRSSVRLLNDTTRSATFTGVAPKSSETASRPETSTAPIELTVVFQVVAENNKNHLACVNQVLEFQDFYNRLRGASRVPSN